MEQKKTLQADLENERTTFFLLGLVVVLATLFVLFEWSTEDALSSDWEDFSSIYIEEELTESPVPGFVSEPEDEKKLPETVYENYNVVEKVSEEKTEEKITPVLIEKVAQIHEIEIPLAELTQELTEEKVYIEPEVMPQYFGGYTALIRFIFNNIQYSSDALQNKIQGRVWCSFIVNTDGSTSDIQIEQSLYPSLDQEVLRVLALMPVWIPGSVKEKPVRVKCYLSIVFNL